MKREHAYFACNRRPVDKDKREGFTAVRVVELVREDDKSRGILREFCVKASRGV